MYEPIKIVTTNQLSNYISALRERMKVIGYAKSTLFKYERVWKDLLNYTSKRINEEFTVEYGIRFISETYGGFFEHQASRSGIYRPVTALLDFIKLGIICRQNKSKIKGFTGNYKELFDGFLKTQIERGLSARTIIAIRSRLYRTERFFMDLGVKSFNELTRSIVNLYIESFISESTSTASSSLREFGRLCDYAVSAGFHTESFSNMIPHIKNLRRQRLPHIFTRDEIQRLLSVINRNNPTGKRDYAMLITIARLGLRVGDVRMLSFSSIDWSKKTISIIQEKTKRFLELPLLDDVGWAIIDYMKNGRPICNSEFIFVSHTVPYQGLSPTSGNMIAKYMRKAGIETPQNRVCGMHALRHSLASGMLAEGISVPVISSVLGHADINSTEAYLRVDVKNLRKCALEVNL